MELPPLVAGKETGPENERQVECGQSLKMRMMKSKDTLLVLTVLLFTWDGGHTTGETDNYYGMGVKLIFESY